MNHFEQVIALRAEVERLTARVSELEAAPVDWDAQRRRADELETQRDEARAARDNYQRDRDRRHAEVERLREGITTHAARLHHLDIEDPDDQYGVAVVVRDLTRLTDGGETSC